MKKKSMQLFVVYIIGLSVFTSAQNPICPPGLYIPDPTARVWSDGMLYVYGSRDDDNPQYYCSYDHWVLRTPDLIHWEYFPDVFKSKGENDAVPYSDSPLFAPDIAFKNGTYYLYYCQPGDWSEGVATSDSPTGPFTKAQKMNIGKYNQIDPTVFIDDDGQAYYSWGQLNAKIAKLKPNMIEIDPLTINDTVLTKEKHYFHEGNFIAKRNGIYYMVYACEARKKPTCIGYATSQHIMGPYEYRGIIIDNSGCDPDTWNNHGSIVEFKGQWYVFYHRTTHGNKMQRKACIEPITFLEDGSIPEVEMTSQGASGKPLNAFEIIEGECACRMGGNVRIETLTFNKHNFIDPNNNNQLAKIKNGDYAEFKYIDFGKGASEVEICVMPAIAPFTVDLVLGAVDGPVAGSITIPGAEESRHWKYIKDKFSAQGVHALYLKFSSDDEEAMLSLDNFRFR